MRGIVGMRQVDIKFNTKDKEELFLSNTIQQQLNFKLFQYFKSFDDMEQKVCLSSDMVKPFNGEGVLMTWLAKIKLITRLQKVPNFASFIPLFLEGDAFTFYL